MTTHDRELAILAAALMFVAHPEVVA